MSDFADSNALLTTLAQATAEMAQLNRQQNQKLDQLIDQVGRFTEGMTEFRIRLERLEAIVSEQAETSKRQERNIDRLVGIVEALIQRN